MRLMTDADVAAAFAALGWHKPASQYIRYLAEQRAGQRTVIIAHQEDRFVGYVTIAWSSSYPPFREASIPEVADFNVLPDARRQGIGTASMDAAEAHVRHRLALASE